MSVFSRSNRWAVAFVAIVSIGATLAVANLASGQTPVVAEAGVLRLHLDGNDSDGTSSYFRFDEADGTGGYTPGPVQSLAPVTQKCRIDPNGPLAELSVPGGHVGYFDDAIGARISGSKGTPCGQINGTTETLELALGSGLDGLEIDYAELDIELKFDADMRFDLYDGATLVGTETLACSPLSDCGPDSADNDNFRYRLEDADGDLFDRIVFTLIPMGSNAAGSLEGGADGTAACVSQSCDEDNPSGGPSLGETLGTTDSLFHLVQSFDGEIDCGDPAIVEGDGTSSPLASITRHSNIDGATCTKKPYNFFTTADDGTGTPLVSFDPQGSQQAVYTAVVTFLPATVANPVGQGIEYDPDGTGYRPMQWCDEVPAFGPGDILSNDPLPTGESWCIVSSSTITVGGSPTMFQTTWDLFGQDDPNIRPF